MLKIIFEQITKALKDKISKIGVEEKVEEHPDYLLKAKELWKMVNGDLGISNTVGNNLLLKLDEFEKVLLDKFPELTKYDINKIKESILLEVNVGKDKILSQVEAFKK